MFSSRMRRHSLPTRIISTLVALVTVWCLGCSAFEPLMAQLAGMNPGSTMECSPNGGMVSQPEAGGSAVEAVVAGAHHAYECGCQSCYAASPTMAAANTVAPKVPDVVQFKAQPAPGTDRAPLVPPPQVAA